ncbi:hypothetical protein Tco_0122852 [Tanacetum coccineum]
MYIFRRSWSSLSLIKGHLDYFLEFYSKIEIIPTLLIKNRNTLRAYTKCRNIPPTVHPKLPGRNSRIRNSLAGKIGVYTRFFDFANYRIPISQFLVDILGYFQINLSQLSVIVAAKVSHFEILYRVHGFVPIVGNFRRFYINSKNKGWKSFSKCSENAPVFYIRPLDPLKHCNDHLFWVDAFVFPLAAPWHNSKTLSKDPHPTPDEFDANVCDYLADNRAPFRKRLEPFLCFIGIIRYYDLDENCYPTSWANDDEEGEVSLLQLTKDRVVPLAGVNDQGNQNEIIQDEGVHADVFQKL